MATSRTIFFAVAVVVAATNAAPRAPTFKVPEQCKGKGFCSVKPEGYDDLQELITSLLSPHIIAQNMADRIGDDSPISELSPEEDWHNCPYWKSKQSMYAFSVNNETEADYIIQHELLNQPIEIVTCANDKIEKTGTQECFKHLGLAAFNFKTTCQSSTAKRGLFVLDVKTKEIVKKYYDVPCCCSCQITSVV